MAAKPRTVRCWLCGCSGRLGETHFYFPGFPDIECQWCHADLDNPITAEEKREYGKFKKRVRREADES